MLAERPIMTCLYIICPLAHLNAGLVELGEAGQLLPAVDVGVVVLSERHLQLLQLLVAEAGAVAAPCRGQEVAPPAPKSHATADLSDI